MAVINPEDVIVGQVITFRTINPYDNVQRVGRVSSLCEYDIARRFSDIDALHQQVQHADPSIGNAKDMHYLIISYRETNDDIERVIAVAREWISPSSLELVEEQDYVDFRVYNISSTKTADILELIQSAGYTASVLE